jgi:cytochrome bd-type quinol oxidase subunit 2
LRQKSILATETKGKGTLRQRALHESKEFAILALYLYITLGAVIMMKTAVLHTVGVEVAPWGIAIVKAMVLAKFMLFGFAMKLGEGKTTGPLIWPTLQMALAFLGLLIFMTVVEEIVVGGFQHRPIAASFGELFGLRLEETLAGYLIMLLVLIPFFAFRILSRTLGEGRLERMFLSNGSRWSGGNR